MGLSGFGRYALCSCVAAAIFAGCGGSQPPTGAPGAMQQSQAVATRADRGKSWMLPEAKNDDLLYVSSVAESSSQQYVYVLSFPQGKLVGKLGPFSQPGYECVDSSGDVFITNATSGSEGEILEYAHGRKTPIATLDDPGLPQACSVDTTTGNLAVANFSDQILVYPDAQGPPTTYTDQSVEYFWSCTYDSSGDLFAEGEVPASQSPILELPSGGQNIERISIDSDLGGAGDMQWDGQYLDLQSHAHPYRRKHPSYYQSVILRVQVSGSSGTVIGTETLGTEHYTPQFWVAAGSIAQPINERNGGPIGVWDYPSGGKSSTIHLRTKEWLSGVTISAARSDARKYR